MKKNVFKRLNQIICFTRSDWLSRNDFSICQRLIWRLWKLKRKLKTMSIYFVFRPEKWKWKILFSTMTELRATTRNREWTRNPRSFPSNQVPFNLSWTQTLHENINTHIHTFKHGHRSICHEWLTISVRGTNGPLIIDREKLNWVFTGNHEKQEKAPRSPHQ